MPTYYNLQSTFARGELSPRLHARPDIEHWAMGLKECVNWFVMRQGGLRKRSGTRFVGEIKNSAEGARLIPFVFNVEQAYVLELGNGYARVFADGGRVMNGASQVEFSTPYSLQQARELHFAQSADVLYLAHAAHAQRKITRTSDTAWSIAPIAFTNPPADWKANDYPARVGFFQERLAFARTNAKPRTIWFSRAGLLEDHTPPASPMKDTDSIALSLLSGDVDAIQWIVEGQDMILGTTSATRTIGPPGAGAFSPTNLRQRRHTTYGCAPIQPVQIGTTTLFVNRYGDGIREFHYSFNEDTFVAPELSILSEHMLKSRIREWAFAQDPEAIVWMAMGNGELVGLTYEREQKMLALHRHRLGGDAGRGYGEVESVAVIPAANRYELWLIVKRTINGATRRFIEILDPTFEGGDPKDAFFIDSGLTYAGAPTTVIASGLSHLAGTEVAILADGAVLPRTHVAADGSLTLPNNARASTIQVGLPYRAKARTLPFAAQLADGNSFGRRMRVHEVYLDVLETLGFKVGAKESRLEPIKLRGGSDAMDRPVPLLTGSAKVHIEGSWQDRGEIVMVSDDPLPATVRAVNISITPEP